MKKKGFSCKSFQFYEKPKNGKSHGTCKLFPFAITKEKIKENNIKFVVGNVDTDGNCNGFKFDWGVHLKNKIPDPKNKPKCNKKVS